MLKAVFLDRDGTVIEDKHYPRNPDDITFTNDAIFGMRKMIEKGYHLFVVSNQSGVGRGIINDEEFRAVHNRFQELLTEHEITITEFAYCFHRPEDNCLCRKPGTALIPKEIAGKTVDFKNSFVVGDKPCDLKLGEKLGSNSYLILTGKGKATFAQLKSEGNSELVTTVETLLEMAEKLPVVTNA